MCQKENGERQAWERFRGYEAVLPRSDDRPATDDHARSGSAKAPAKSD